MNNRSKTNSGGAALSTERVILADCHKLFSAFARSDSLARWWGPDGFTNTFHHFEFAPGGRWVFIMHGPNGANYPNESIFREIQANAKIVIDHLSSPKFTLTVTLMPQGNHTRLTWVQEFESPEFADRMRPICEPANEQNLDRLESLLAAEPS